MEKKEIISILEDMGTLMELKGENPFKCRAYPNAARSLETTPEDMKTLVVTKKLSDLPGIGKAIHETVLELFRDGRSTIYDELKASIPSGVLEMAKIPGLGPKKVRKIHEALGVQSIGELEYACQENRLMTLEGFGAKSQEKVLQAIRFLRKNQNKFLLADALPEVEIILKNLQALPETIQASLAGSLRRRCEVVSNGNIILTSSFPRKIFNSFVKQPGIQESKENGETETTILLQSGLPVILRCVPENEFTAALHYYTGSREYHEMLKERAEERGLTLDEHGLFKGKDLLPLNDETDLYKNLDLPFIPPERREQRESIEIIEKKFAAPLIEGNHIQGTFHVHTLYSDGTATVKDMVNAARAQGLKYIGISDHSQSAFYAHGLKPADIRKQHVEIDALNQTLKDIRIFKGIESDILKDGSLDYDEEILEQFDFVIASVHSRFKMNEEEMTERIVSALKNPYTTMLGHMTGRLLLSREPYALNIKKIIDTAAEYEKIIELNANPYRLDIDWRYLGYAKEQGVAICINPDAHRLEGLKDIEFGIGMARKGGLGKEDVFNTRSVGEVEKYLDA